VRACVYTLHAHTRITTHYTTHLRQTCNHRIYRHVHHRLVLHPPPPRSLALLSQHKVDMPCEVMGQKAKVIASMQNGVDDDAVNAKESLHCCYNLVQWHHFSPVSAPIYTINRSTVQRNTIQRPIYTINKIHCTKKRHRALLGARARALSLSACACVS